MLREGNAVFRIDGDTRRLTRIAGTGETGYSGDGGPAIAARFNGPKGIAYAPDRSVYVVDTENHVIRRVDLKTAKRRQRFSAPASEATGRTAIRSAARWPVRTACSSRATCCTSPTARATNSSLGIDATGQRSEADSSAAAMPSRRVEHSRQNSLGAGAPARAVLKTDASPPTGIRPQAVPASRSASERLSTYDARRPACSSLRLPAHAAPLHAQAVKTITLQVSETTGIRRTEYPVSARVEVPRGGLAGLDHVRLRADGGRRRRAVLGGVPLGRSVGARARTGLQRQHRTPANRAAIRSSTVQMSTRSASVPRGLTLVEEAEAIQVGNMKFGEERLLH